MILLINHLFHTFSGLLILFNILHNLSCQKMQCLKVKCILSIFFLVMYRHQIPWIVFKTSVVLEITLCALINIHIENQDQNDDLTSRSYMLKQYHSVYIPHCYCFHNECHPNKDHSANGMPYEGSDFWSQLKGGLRRCKTVGYDNIGYMSETHFKLKFH